MENLKREGSALFAKKEFFKSAECYTRAIQESDGDRDINVFLNRAAAYLNLRYFNRALEDAESVLQIDGSDRKAIFTKVKALCGLKRYEDSVTFLRGNWKIPRLFNDLAYSDLLKTTFDMELQSKTGDFDILQLYECKKRFKDSFADFVGPVIINIDGKCKGLITTADVVAGQVLIGSKAFEIVFTSDEDPKLQIIEKVTQKLKFEPELVEEFIEFCSKVENGEDENDDKIANICNFCLVGGTDPESELKETKFWFPSQDDVHSVGLWILPSQINHSCCHFNCFAVSFGDLLIVRASKNISQGEELLIFNLMTTPSFKDKENNLKCYDFKCSCRSYPNLTEPEVLRNTRDSLLKDFDKHLTNPLLVKNLMSKLEYLKNPELNIDLALNLVPLALKNYHKGRWEESIEYFTKVFQMLKKTPFVWIPLRCALYIITAEIKSRGVTVEVKKWIRLLKIELSVTYGSFEMLKNAKKNTLKIIMCDTWEMFQNLTESGLI